MSKRINYALSCAVKHTHYISKHNAVIRQITNKQYNYFGWQRSQCQRHGPDARPCPPYTTRVSRLYLEPFSKHTTV